MLNWSSTEQRQIRKLSQGRSNLLTELQLTDVPSPWMKRFEQAVPKSPKEMSALRRRLTAAGYRSATTAVIYALAEMVLPVRVWRHRAAVLRLLALVLSPCSAALGFVAPSLWLGRKTKLRQKQIRNGLPDALDLMIVCIESGRALTSRS